VHRRESAWYGPATPLHSAHVPGHDDASLGVFYVLEAGPFLGMVRSSIYTGAIMMLFLFFLMLVAGVARTR
jgi:NADH:ubiquinone oxidoreductase subunit 6 (subunit J)